MPGPVSLKRAAVRDDALMSSLKVALIFWLSGKSVPASAGPVAIMMGIVVSADPAVTKHQAKSVASGLPARSSMPVTMVAV